MEVYNQEKTQVLETYDLNLGYLIKDSITKNKPEVIEVKEQGHYEVTKEYSNGGKDVKWVVDVKGIKGQKATTYEEEILVYKLYTEHELNQRHLENLRNQREVECFNIINRGQLWYNMLSEEQVNELNTWYKKWLDVTKTLEIPNKPKWLGDGK